MENKMKDYFSKIKELFGDKNKKAAYIIFIGSLGILLILLSDFISDTPSDKKDSSYIYPFDFNQEEEELEKKLSDIISKIKGAGNTVVMITFDSSKELFFEKNLDESKNDSENSNETELVILENENGETPVLLKAKEEKIRGVLIICEGGGNPVVKEKIMESVCALLDIPSTKVSVAEMA